MDCSLHAVYFIWKHSMIESRACGVVYAISMRALIACNCLCPGELQIFLISR